MSLFVLFLITFAIGQDVETTEAPETKPTIKNEKPKPLPKYEFGLGYIFGDIPDYPGANEKTIRSFPIPYFVYRGDVLQAERGGIRTRFLKGKYYEYDFSFSGAFPANSSDNDAREGMSDLGWMFEAGPQLKLFLLKSKVQNWTVKLPVRAIFSLDDGQIHGRGYSFNPSLQISFPKFPFKRNILSLGFTTDFATKKTHEYFYEVRQKDVTADRPLFSAQKGLLGSSIDVTLITSWSKYAVFINTNFSFYGEAKNKDSPLHLDNQTQSVAAGFIWSFYQSKDQGFR
ncbi:MAG: MipA/OmpV family protein [Bdellovibrionales bacterium]|nr:MipA/OmpV family protein [Bdellovibrionales bacterium]